MVSAVGTFVIVLVVLLIAAAAGWVIFTQLRARRLGLPPPTLSSYNPFKRSDHHSPYGPPQPAPSGIGSWFSDKFRSLRGGGGGGNKRSAAGGYEQSRRGFGPLDPDEAWDTRVADEHYGPGGYYEEQELGLHGSGGAGGRGAPSNPFGDNAGYHSSAPSANPFDDHMAEPSNLRGVSPRPIDTSVANAAQNKKHHGPSSGSPTSERRSMFREDVS